MALVMGQGKIEQTEVRIRVQGHLPGLRMIKGSSTVLLGVRRDEHQ